MNRDEILMIYGTGYKEMSKELLCQADLADLAGDRSKRIGIKPNLVSPSEALWGATTHPEIVAGIIEYLQEHGFDQIVMMEGSWVGDHTQEAVKRCGFERISEQYGVPFIDTQKDRYHARDCGGMVLQICDCVDAVDLMINVPVLKGHCQTKLTCALKNMKGLIPNSEKRRFHTLGLHKPIGHLGAGIDQDFVVVDNICGDLNFEDGGSPVSMNRIWAALDPVLCDAYACHMLHYEKGEVPYIGIAESLGAGCGDWRTAHVRWCGEPSGTLAAEAGKKIVMLQDAVEEVESCSACYAYLIPVLDRLHQEGLLDKLATKVRIGQGWRGKVGKLGIGKCTCLFEHHLEGCPPTDQQMYDFLKTYILENP